MDQAELEAMLGRGPVLGGVLSYLMSSLDRLASAPFAHLAKGGDPISLHHAVEYITANEMTNTIFILHFVDDRAAVRDVNNQLQRRREEEGEKGGGASAESSAGSNFNSEDDGSLLRLFLSPGAMRRELPPPSIPAATAIGAAPDTGAFRFDLAEALQALPSKTRRLVHTVAIIDAFHT